MLPKGLEEALDVAGFEAGAGAARGIVNPSGEHLLALLQFEHAQVLRQDWEPSGRGVVLVFPDATSNSAIAVRSMISACLRSKATTSPCNRGTRSRPS